MARKAARPAMPPAMSRAATTISAICHCAGPEEFGAELKVPEKLPAHRVASPTLVPAVPEGHR